MSQPENENQSRSASQASNRPPSQASNPKAESNNKSNSSPNQSQPASVAGSRSASQASNRPPSQASNKQGKQNQQSRPPSQVSNHSQPSNKVQSRPASQASKPPSKAGSRTSSPSITRDSRPPRTPRGRSRTPRSISSASSLHDAGSDEENRAPTPTADNPELEPEENLPDVDEEEGEGDNAVSAVDKGKAQTQGGTYDDEGDNNDKGEGRDKKKRRRRGKKGTKGFSVNQWPHGDNPGRMEPPHGVDDWPHVDEEGEGVGTSGRVLQRPKGVRDFSPAYAPSDAGSTNSAQSSVSGLSLGDWSRSSLPGVDTWPYGDNPGIMVKPLDHWGQPLKNSDGTLMQKENWTGLPSYDELRDMDLDTHDDHVIKLKLELDIDVAIEINARIHGDLTLALLM